MDQLFSYLPGDSGQRSSRGTQPIVVQSCRGRAGHALLLPAGQERLQPGVRWRHWRHHTLPEAGVGGSRSSSQSCPWGPGLSATAPCLHSCCSCAPDGVGTRLEKACPLGVERVAPSPHPPASSPGEPSFSPCSVPFTIQSCFSFASTAWRSRHPSPPAPPPSPAPPAGTSPQPSPSWLPCGGHSGS